jgi:hypothetical protein
MTNTLRRGGQQARPANGRDLTSITVAGSNTRSRLGAFLIIECVDTADMPDGQSLPPYNDVDGAFWRVVRRLPSGYTRWRRIHIQPS